MNSPGLDAATLASRIAYDCQLFVLDTTTSTNDEAVRKAQESTRLPAVPLVVISNTQTSGRGRLGRTWASPAGGLYLSILLTIETRARADNAYSMASLSPLVALTARDALQVFTSSEILVKWPNDVLTPAGKLAGILIEVKPASALFNNVMSNALVVVVGIGVNVNRPNAGALEAAAYLSDSPDQYLQLETVASALTNNLLRQIAAWQAEGCCFGSFVSSYMHHMAGIGEAVCVRDACGAEVASGTVKGIDELGRLLLQATTGEIAVTSGEVTLRKP